MAMPRTYGRRRMTKPAGMLRAVYFPVLARTDTLTGDGRLIEDAGFGVRELTLTIFGGFTEDGHSGAVVTGALDEVTIEDNVVSGYGWLLDDDNGRTMIRYAETGALRGNSIGLSDARVSWEWDEENERVLIRFIESNLSKTTFVGNPAFADARGELLGDDEIVASWYADEEPLVVTAPFSVELLADLGDEIVADGEPRPAWEMFHQREADRPLALHATGEKVGEFEQVVGHVALWESCLNDDIARCVRVPRPPDGYASFNQPGVLTDRGIVETGPVFLTGGHRRAVDDDYVSAYGGVENAVYDIHVVPGRFGPWASGYVRPGVPEDRLAWARASRVSGHWKGGKLRAVVAVNAEGFNVPGTGFASGGFAFDLDSDGHVDEMVASFPECADYDDEADGPDGDNNDDDGYTADEVELAVAMMALDDD